MVTIVLRSSVRSSVRIEGPCDSLLDMESRESRGDNVFCFIIIHQWVEEEEEEEEKEKEKEKGEEEEEEDRIKRSPKEEKEKKIGEK